jgi:dCTP deaminase
MMEEVVINNDRQFILHPGDFALGMTYETVSVPNDMVVQLNGKSSLGRIGLIVHATAGYVDPGNTLKITLELHNLANLPIKLYYKMPIAQVAFVKLSSEAEIPYGKDALNSKYFGSTKPVASQYYKNFLKNQDWMTFDK